MASWGGDSVRGFQKALAFGKKLKPEPGTQLLLKDSKQGSCEALSSAGPGRVQDKFGLFDKRREARR